MEIEINYEAEEALELPYEEIINKVIIGALDEENFPYECQVSVMLADDARIKEINHRFRYIDNTTDVLSFPMCDFKAPGDFGVLEDELADLYYFDPGTGDVMLGDIAISVQKVKSQAEAYGHSEERELGFLIAHSMLHLMGYDHMEAAERELMEEKQRIILNNLGITR